MKDANTWPTGGQAKDGDVHALASGWGDEPPEFCLADRHQRAPAIEDLAPNGLMGWLFRWLQKGAD